MPGVKGSGQPLPPLASVDRRALRAQVSSLIAPNESIADGRPVVAWALWDSIALADEPGPDFLLLVAQVPADSACAGSDAAAAPAVERSGRDTEEVGDVLHAP